MQPRAPSAATVPRSRRHGAGCPGDEASTVLEVYACAYARLGRRGACARACVHPTPSPRASTVTSRPVGPAQCARGVGSPALQQLSGSVSNTTTGPGGPGRAGPCISTAAPANTVFKPEAGEC